MKWEIAENRIPTKSEVRQLVKAIKERADAAKVNENRQPMVDWAVLHTLIGSGIRSMEVAKIQIGDLRIGHGEAAIVIQSGKGGKSRIAAITERLKRHLQDFLKWKQAHGEPTTPESSLFLSERRSRFTTRAIRYLFKRCLERAGVKTAYGVHALRHFHLSELYSSTKDLRLVQDQAGHSSPATTAIYAHVSLGTRQQAVERLF